MSFEFVVETKQGEELLDITERVTGLVREHGKDRRICQVFVPHTTAGITINEHADPDVKSDLLLAMRKVVPFLREYRHVEGNSPSHVKASLTGSSVSVPVDDGRLLLGTWQGIFLAEFDGPRRRTVIVTLV